MPLTRRERTLVCPRGHSYDVARSGYVNLLQPQDRRSRTAGDAKTAVDARARLLAAGIGRVALDDFVGIAAALDLGERPVVVDLGSGAGGALAALASRRPIDGVGIDLAAAAADHAARRYPGLTWVVANADRRLPILDSSIELALSLHGRRNPAECARALAPSGLLLVAVPAHDDLIELRELVQGKAIERERADTLLAEHEPFFTIENRSTVRERHRLERESLLDLLRSTYRGERTSAAAGVSALTNLEVTLASDLFLFMRR